jgi:hypothetical protein
MRIGPHHQQATDPLQPESTAAVPFLRPEAALRRVLDRDRARRGELEYSGPSNTHRDGWQALVQALYKRARYHAPSP